MTCLSYEIISKYFFGIWCWILIQWSDEQSHAHQVGESLGNTSLGNGLFLFSTFFDTTSKDGNIVCFSMNFFVYGRQSWLRFSINLDWGELLSKEFWFLEFLHGGKEIVERRFEISWDDGVEVDLSFFERLDVIKGVSHVSFFGNAWVNGVVNNLLEHITGDVQWVLLLESLGILPGLFFLTNVEGLLSGKCGLLDSLFSHC